MRTILFFTGMFFSFCVSAQKIVFRDDYHLKNISMNGGLSAGGARIIEDSTTKEKLLIYTGKKEFIFYLLDAKWKLLQKISKDDNKESQLKDDDFSILKSHHDKKKWSFIVRSVNGYAKESVDFATGTHMIEEKYLEDMAKNYMEERFADGDKKYIMYLNNKNEIALTSFSNDFTTKNIRFDLSSQLPLKKSKKYSGKDLYNLIETIDSLTVRKAFFTRKKVHFYIQPDKYAVLIAGDEPVAELSFYDKSNGRKIKSDLFSVEELLPSEGKGEKYNTAALLYDNKVHVLASYKSGGVYAMFDANTKKVIYQYVYSEKDKSKPFNYGPVLYETLPGTLNLNVLKEKVEDISMEKFCGEMFKHSCAITASQMIDGNLLIRLANYDLKELAAATSTLRSGINTMSSPAWYASASAGFIFEPGAVQPSAKKTTWNELYESEATSKYTKIQPAASSGAEYNDKKSIIIKTQVIGNRLYHIYYNDKELKVDEKILPFTPPQYIIDQFD